MAERQQDEDGDHQTLAKPMRDVGQRETADCEAGPETGGDVAYLGLFSAADADQEFYYPACCGSVLEGAG